MNPTRHHLLLLAAPRIGWASMLVTAASDGVLPADVTRCVSLDEVRTRLRTGQPYRAVVIDGDLPGVDRDLIAVVAEAGAAPVVVTDASDRWTDTGTRLVLTTSFAPWDLEPLFEDVGEPSAADAQALPGTGAAHRAATDGARRLVAVIGPGGSGTSTVAIALAQGLAGGRSGRHRRRITPTAAGPVLLADLCRAGDHALLHDVAELQPGLPELVEAHRGAAPELSALHGLTYEIPTRGYRLLLGLRHPSQWVALRPEATRIALQRLWQLAPTVVADIDPELEDEERTGAADLDDRHRLTRETLLHASRVVVTITPGLVGLQAAVRLLTDITSTGWRLEHVLPVITRSPRSPRQRAQLTAALATAIRQALGDRHGILTNPLHLPQRAVEPAVISGQRLPEALADALVRADAALPERRPAAAGVDQPSPVAVVPGSLQPFTARERR